MTRVTPFVALSLLLLGACSDQQPASPLDRSIAAPTDASSSILPGSRTVFMTNLDSPRGLAWGPEGALYVAEAGNTTMTGLCAPVERGQNCYSGTGAISRFWKGKQERVASRLPSHFNPAIGDISGPQHLSFQGRGNMKVTIGFGGAPSARAGLGELGKLFGVLLDVTPNGSWRVAADVAAFEGANNPAGGPFDSNPYGVLAEAGQTFVADAGANALLRVREHGEVSLVAVFPSLAVPAGPFNPPFARSDAVPTSVTRGPDGALYVSTLTGAPFLPGVASIYRVFPGHAPQVYATGFTQITDVAWGDDGSMYVLQYASAPFFGGPGSVIRVWPGGARTTVATGLQHPAGLLIGGHGDVFVTNNSDKAGIGEVIRFMP
jgi:hypothetical protein